MLTALQLNLLAVFEKDSTFWLPAARSKYSQENDWVWDVVIYVSIFFFFVVVGSMTYFLIKYRRKGPNDVVSTVTHNTPIELVWTILPLILVMWFFKVGFTGFIDYSTPPSDAIVITAEAKQWSFKFIYPNGAESEILYVPKGRPVRLSMTSQDATHALYIPNFHISKNMIRARTTDLWFEATQESGEAGYPLYCTQYCGKDHSRMFTKVVVYNDADWNKKLAQLDNIFKDGDKYLSYAQVGEKIYKTNCASCHTTDGSNTRTAPSWDTFWVRDHKFGVSNVPGFVLHGTDPDAKKYAYIAESVMHPEAKVVETYGNQMSSFASSFSDNAAADPDKDLQDYKKYQKVLAVAEFMKTLSNGKSFPDGTVYKYDPSKAPVFKEPKGASASAPGVSGSESSAVTAPANNTRP